MFSIYSDNIDDLYIQCLKKIIKEGHVTHPRGFTCYELSPCETTLFYPDRNILCNPNRKASRAFMGAELLWMLMGRKDVEMISFYNSQIAKFSDDGKEFFGAYGPKIMPQLPYIIETLRQDPWSRQALINIWRESPAPTKDVPCTVTFQFLQRPLGTLNMVVYMRSQDIWLGFPYDVHNFTSIQMLVASMLGIKLGKFTLIQGSLHMYENNLEAANIASRWNTTLGALWSTPESKIKSMGELNGLMQYLRDCEYDFRSNENMMIFELNDALLNQKIKWLYDYARKKHEAR